MIYPILTIAALALCLPILRDAFRDEDWVRLIQIITAYFILVCVAGFWLGVTWIEPPVFVFSLVMALLIAGSVGVRPRSERLSGMSWMVWLVSLGFMFLLVVGELKVPVADLFDESHHADYFFGYLVVLAAISLVRLEANFRYERPGYSASVELLFFVIYLALAAHGLLFGAIWLNLLFLIPLLVFGAYWGHFLLSRNRHQVSNVELLSSRRFWYSSFILTALGVYLLLVAGSVMTVRWLGGNLHVVFIAVTSVTFGFIVLRLARSGAVRLAIRRLLLRKLLRSKHDFRELWGRLSEAIAIHRDHAALSEVILDFIAEVLGCDSGAILLKSSDDRKVTLLKKKMSPGCRIMDWQRTMPFVNGSFGWTGRFFSTRCRTMFRIWQSSAMSGRHLSQKGCKSVSLCRPNEDWLDWSGLEAGSI